MFWMLLCNFTSFIAPLPVENHIPDANCMTLSQQWSRHVLVPACDPAASRALSIGSYVIRIGIPIVEIMWSYNCFISTLDIIYPGKMTFVYMPLIIVVPIMFESNVQLVTWAYCYNSIKALSTDTESFTREAN